MATYEQIAEGILNGKAKVVQQLVQEALTEGFEAEDILNNGLIVGMNQVGELFKNNEIYVPEVLIAARAMYKALDILKPILASKDVKTAGVVAIGTVEGDLHDIGKNLVAMMLEGNGFTVVDLGTDVSPDQYVDAVENKGCNLIAMSALLTTTMPKMKETVDALKAKGLRDKVRIMIGGAPVTQSFCDEIGADGYSSDAASAADLAKKLVAELA